MRRIAELCAALDAAVDDIGTAVQDLDLGVTTCTPLGRLAIACERAATAAAALRAELAGEFVTTARQGAEARAARGSGASGTTWKGAANEVDRFAGLLSSLINDLGSEPCRLVDNPALLLTGDGGSGKTHLLCDAAKIRLNDHHPTVVLLGQWFTSLDPPFPQLLETLDLGCSAEQFLGALSCAAEIRNCRAILMIDALNEGQGRGLWNAHLAAFVHTVAQFPAIGLALSCRTAYVEDVIPDEVRGSVVELEHTGFQGVEYEAVTAFFGYYALPMPTFPLLWAEFSNPLFLSILCKWLEQAIDAVLTPGHLAADRLFDGFLTAANAALATPERCDYDRGLLLVQRAVNNLAEEMVRSGDTVLTLEVANQLVGAVHSGPGGYSKSLLKGLIDEDVLSRNPDGNGGEVISFVYQRLSDDMRAKMLCDSMTEAQLAHWIRAYSGPGEIDPGLLGALSIRLPAIQGRELYELAGFDTDSILELVLDNVHWRSPSTFADPAGLRERTVAFLVSRPDCADEVVNALLLSSCIPEHPLNAENLDDWLRTLAMPDRDYLWSLNFASPSRGRLPVRRLLDWSVSQAFSQMDPITAGLYATTVTWLMTSSNRHIRDSATKALVETFRLVPGLIAEHLSRFVRLNDPYVMERVLAAAYGWSIRTFDVEAVSTVARRVHDLVFEDAPPLCALSRDYGRGVALRALELGAELTEAQAAAINPPYPSPWPLSPPTEADLESTHGREYSPILRTLNTMSDFGRYVVEELASDFASSPEAQEGPAEPIGSDDAETDDEGPVEHFTLHVTARQPTDAFPADEARRWVVNRALELGWKPERFAGFDDYATQVRHRAADEGPIEGIGKKYLWIAAHELAGILSDHLALLESDANPYSGPWQIGMRDVDPSLGLPTRTRTSNAWRNRATIAFPNSARAGDNEAWVDDDSPVLDGPSLAAVRDLDGKEWLVLHSYYDWSSELPRLPGEPLAKVWAHLHAYLVRREEASAMARWAARQDWFNRWMPEPELHGAYLGEYPWRPVSELGVPLWSNPGRGAPGEFGLTGLRWSAADSPRDYSFPDPQGFFLPSPLTLDGMDLQLAEAGVRYSVPSGETAAMDPTWYLPGRSCLLVAKGSLLDWLDREQLTLVWTLLGEKQLLLDAQPKINVITGALVLRDGVVEAVRYDQEPLAAALARREAAKPPPSDGAKMTIERISALLDRPLIVTKDDEGETVRVDRDPPTTGPFD